MLRYFFEQLIRAGKDGQEERSSPDTMLSVMDSKIHNFDTYIHPLPESKPRTPFDSPNKDDGKRGAANLTLMQLMKIVPQTLPLFWYISRGSNLYNEAFKPKQNEVTPKFIKQLEALAYKYGVKDIKYIKVPQNAIFKDKGIPHEYAIVFTVEMDKEPISTSPSFDSIREVMKGYKNAAIIANKLSQFIRNEGVAAYPGTAIGGTTDYVHLAELAGLGAIGYHGLLISPTEGARLRIGTIYTNIENLPIQQENEHLWVRDFCAMCKKCVRKCPVSAIYDEPKPRGDGGMQCIDHDLCRDYFDKNYGCAVCLAVCPFSQVGYDKVKERFKGNPDAPQFIIPLHITESSSSV
ncbi:MAG: reductive dehalogenase domain-containing protein [Chloroflexota bacterium]